MSFKYYEVIFFNIVICGMLEKVMDWDVVFIKFEVDFFFDKDV